jgi:hypothetical protein
MKLNSRRKTKAAVAVVLFLALICLALIVAKWADHSAPAAAGLPAEQV